MNGFNGLGTSDLKNTVKLTLDKYGFIIDVDEDDTDEVYAYVKDVSTSVNRGDYDYAAKLLFSDGSQKWVDVAEVNDDKVADGDVSTSNMNALKGTFVSYTEGTNGYDLDSVSTNTGDSTYYATGVTGKIEKGSTTIFGAYTASTKTIFLVKGNSGYTVYEGIKNVKDMDVASSAEDKAIVLVDDGVAVMVVIDDSAVTDLSDQVFIYKAAVSGTEKDGSTVVNYYKALVNGEDTTIGVKDGNAVSVGLYVNNSYKGDDTDSYIETLGDKVDGTTSVEDTAYVGSLTDVTLKNGILTFKAGSTTAKVVANDFNAYVINSAKAEASDVSLDKDSTVTSEGWTMTGAYAAYTMDSDGYVTNLYIVVASIA